MIDNEATLIDPFSQEKLSIKMLAEKAFHPRVLEKLIVRSEVGRRKEDVPEWVRSYLHRAASNPQRGLQIPRSQVVAQIIPYFS